MENLPVESEKPKLQCVLNCKDSKNFFRFPRDEAPRKIWLERIGLNALPACISMSRICNNHFSERMFSEGGKRLTRCAIPDINIPGKLIDTTPDGNLQIIKPRPVPNYMNLEEIPRIVPKAEIITSRGSRCFLKCKDAKSTFGFPQDKPSLDVWAKQLGLKEMPRRSATARICKNHFSARMFTKGKGRRLTRCAIPDINLPGQMVFRPEDVTSKNVIDNEVTEYTTLNVEDDRSEVILNTVNLSETTLHTSQNEQEITDLFRSLLDPPLIIEDCTQTSKSEIFSEINIAPNKKVILHGLQSGNNNKSDDKDGEPLVTLPEDVVDADSECVLKCPHGERLFRFPNMESNRQIWLQKIGLTHCFFNTRICNRHFSDRMFVKSKKRLAKFAYPDINIPQVIQPRVKNASKQDEHVCDVRELPEFICVVTVFKKHTEVDAAIHGIKYVKHKIDENIPKREREVQVDMADLIRTSNVAIPADDYVDDIDIEENVDYHQRDWINMFKSHVFATKADMYECLLCGEISVGYDCNVKHSNMHQESSLLCFECGRLFPNQYKLKMHEKDKHRNQLRKALRCPKLHCKKAFHSRKQLHHHVDEHTRRVEHKCRNCLRVFSSSLKLHCHQVACRNYWTLKYRKRTNNGTRAKIK